MRISASKVIVLYNFYLQLLCSYQLINSKCQCNNFLLYFRVSVDKGKEAISDSFTFACTLYRALGLQRQIVCSLMLQRANYSLQIGYINSFLIKHCINLRKISSRVFSLIRMQLNTLKYKDKFLLHVFSFSISSALCCD